MWEARALPPPYRCACDVRRAACVALYEGLEFWRAGRACASADARGRCGCEGAWTAGARSASRIEGSGVAGVRHLNKESGGTGLWVYGDEDAPPCAAVDQLHLVRRDALGSGCFVFTCM